MLFVVFLFSRVCSNTLFVFAPKLCRGGETREGLGVRDGGGSETWRKCNILNMT